MAKIVIILLWNEKHSIAKLIIVLLPRYITLYYDICQNANDSFLNASIYILQ